MYGLWVISFTALWCQYLENANFTRVYRKNHLLIQQDKKIKAIEVNTITFAYARLLP